MNTPILQFTPGAEGVPIDLEKLVAGRGLVQGSSGAGKSRLLRYILEQTYGRIQHFVFDPEGELVTMREKFDYVVVSASGDGDLRADPKKADLLCRQLVQLQASAIFDLSELDPEDRQRFIGRFLHRQLNLPKELWHPVLDVVDEAHEYAPEHGQPESRKPMELLVSKGRKRGHCALFATTRLSLLSKNASDLNNIFIGYTGLDVDVRRAGDILGFDKAQREALKSLEHEFFAFGPAVSREVTKVRAGDIRTYHPKPGEIRPPTPPASSALADLIAQMAAVPATAEDEEGDEASDDVAPRGAARARPPEGWVSPAELARRVREAATEAETRGRAAGAAAAIAQLRAQVRPAIDGLGEHYHALHHALANGSAPEAPASPPEKPATTPLPSRGGPVRAPRAKASPLQARPSSGDLPSGERAVLIAIAQHKKGAERDQIGILTGYKKSSRNTYLSRLSTKRLITEENGRFTATEAGISILGDDYEPLPKGKKLREYWLAKLPVGEAAILALLIDAYPGSVTREALSTKTGYLKSSRNTYLSRLGARRLVNEDAGGMRAVAELF